jgi:hypothetical protein
MGYSPCSWSGVTSTGRSCLDKPVSGLPSDQRRFDWHSLTMDPVDRGAASQGRKGVIHKGDGEGGGIESPPIPSPPCQRTQVWGGGIPIPHFFIAQLAAHRSLSFSSHAHATSLEACLASHPMASMGMLASRDSTWPPPRPYARL